MRKVFRLRREKIIVYWKKFPREDLRDLTPYQYYSGDQMKRVGWAGNAVHMVEKRNELRVLQGNQKLSVGKCLQYY